MTTNTRYLVMRPADIHRICGEGDGDSIGLPCVPEDQIDEVIRRVQRVLDTHDFACGCPVCELYETCCVECDTVVSNIEREDEYHVIVGEAVLIGCEGFHTAVFRAAQFVTNE